MRRTIISPFRRPSPNFKIYSYLTTASFFHSVLQLLAGSLDATTQRIHILLLQARKAAQA